MSEQNGAIHLANDDWIKIEINGACKELDLWDAHNRLCEIGAEYKGQPARLYHQAIVTYLAEELGYPVEPRPISHGVAMRFSEAVFGRTEGMLGQKKTDSSPEPVASTASTSSIQPSPATSS
jgi:hypothetical protein